MNAARAGRTACRSAALAVCILAGPTTFATAQDRDAAPPLDAVVRVGIIRGQAVDSHADPARVSTSALAVATVETAHKTFGAGIDGALALELGREPLLIMQKTAPADVRPAFADGVVAAVALRFAHASGRAEAAVVGRAGSARTDDGSAAASNDIGPWAGFADARVDLRWYARPVVDARASGEQLMPVLQMYAGLRHDQRFHRAGDLAGFDDPTGRVIAGLVASPFRIASARGGNTPLLTIGAGVDVETALRGDVQLPSGFAALVRADLNLTRALMRH